MNQWNRNKIVEELRKKSRELGHSVSTREAGGLLYQVSRYHFGSFNKAKQAAGLSVFPLKHHQLKRGCKRLGLDLSYILGVLYGDGHYRLVKTPKRTSGSMQLKVKDLDFAKEFYRRLEKWSGVSPKFLKKDDEFYYVALYSVDAVRIVQGIELTQILSSTKRIQANFIKGLYDSEGGVTGTNLKRRRFACRWIHFSNNNKEIIDIVQKILNNFSIKYKLRSRVHSGFGSTKLQYELLIFGLFNFEEFYKKVGFSIKRKEKKLLEVIYSYEKYQKSSCL